MSVEKRNILFIGLVFLVVVGTPYIFRFVFGPMAQQARPAGKQAADDKAEADTPDGEAVPAAESPQEKPDAAKVAVEVVAPAAAAEKPAPKPDEPEPEPEPEPATRTIGSTEAADGFKMRVELSNEGASVRRLELADFRAEDRRGPLALLDVEPGELGSLLLDVPGNDAKLATRIWKIIDDADEPAANDDPATSGDTQSVRFQTTLAGSGLVVTKTFRLRKASHNLELVVEITNPGDAAANASYVLGGPRGFVLEGAWYANKLRDAAIGDGSGATLKRHTVRPPALVNGAKKILSLDADQKGIVKDKWTLPRDWFDEFDRDANGRLTGDEVRAAANGAASSERCELKPVRYAGVDGQFFCALLLVPPPTTLEDRWDAAAITVLILKPGELDELKRNGKIDHPERRQVGVNVRSRSFPLDAGESLRHTYTLYAGPRKRDVLEAAIGDPAVVDSIINFQGVLYIFPPGLVGFMASAMLWLLQKFHLFTTLFSLDGNWGIAVIMLTVLVRLCLFPISRKQAMRAQVMQQKMAALKPELDKLKEKHKNDVQKFSAAQFELMKKHGVDPRSQLAGCLPLLLQMPIFVGLWQGLSSSVDLRQANFFGWIDDLSAPDQLFKWGEHIPIISWAFGPYFNLLPAILMGLFFVQQKLFMPPQTSPPDPQVEMQQKMMTWTMLMFGYFFWRLPSGLCLYYIASTLWGITERKLLPKIQHVTSQATEEPERDRDGGSRKGPRRDGRGPKSSNGNGLSLKDRFQELLKKASKK